MPNGIGMVEPEDPVGREDKGRGAWRYPSSYSPAVSIGAWANRGPMRVDGNGDTVETNGDPVGTNGEREPEPVCTGVSRGGYGRRRGWWGDLIVSPPSIRVSDSSLVLALGPRPAPGIGAENENKSCTVPREGTVR
jgi:hypothetical protein